jgi:cytochrome oxidase Cu insertion factor (SCO1/SenC/PrrC family)
VRVASIAVACCALLCAAACSPSSPGDAATPSSYSGTTLDRPLPPGVEYLPLVDQDARRVTLKSLRGKTIVLADFLTSCQEVCPLTSATMQQVVRAVDRAGLGGQVVVLEATVDPTRDTPARLRAYQRLFGKTPGWDFLTGTPANLAALWAALGVAYHRTPEPAGAPLPRDWQTGRPLHYDVTHQDVIFLIDAAGHERWVAIGPPGGVTTPDLPPAMAGFLNDEGHQNLASPDPQAWSASDVTKALSQLLGVPVDPAP